MRRLEKYWKCVTAFFSSHVDLVGGRVGLTNDSLEIEVKWGSKNDGGGHLYMVIYTLIIVSLY
jgi:hypothetical protein